MTKYTFTFVATAMAASLMSASSASAQQATNIANDGRFWEIVALNHAFSSAFNQTVDQMPPAEADAFVSMLMSDAYMQGDGPSTFFNDYGLGPWAGIRRRRLDRCAYRRPRADPHVASPARIAVHGGPQ